MFAKFNVSQRTPGLLAPTCKAHCYFSVHPCTIYAVDEVNLDCYMGNRDTHNEMTIALTDDLEIFESKGDADRDHPF